MITITKDEKDRLSALFPHEHFARTMKQKSKRHHYMCPESYQFMKVIEDTNLAAAEFVREYESNGEFRRTRQRYYTGKGLTRDTWR